MDIYRRKIIQKFIDWKKEEAGSTALLVKGARRIGKSTVAEEFAKKNYKSYIKIDFAESDNTVMRLFDNVRDLDLLFLRLQNIYGVTLHRRESVILMDEIQLCPKARQAIKYLVKDGRYDYIETGSLLSIKKNTKDIVIPSEETRITMYPMDFEEFLWAIGKQGVYDLIQHCFNHKVALGDAAHRSTMTLFRLYMLIGGMPQAVEGYLSKNDFRAVDRIKRRIVELYSDDYMKIDPTGTLSKLFMAIPSQLSANASRYKVGNVIKDARPGRMAQDFAEMSDSMTVNFEYHANDPNVGLPLKSNNNLFKMFVADTGLFVTMAFWDKDYTDNDIYKKLLTDKLAVDLGYVYENVVAQALKSAGSELFYYTFQQINENGLPRNYEIDFLLSRHNKLCPVEVKSSGYKSHKSLDLFQTKFSSRILERYLLYTKDVRKDGDILCLPVYMASLL